MVAARHASREELYEGSMGDSMKSISITIPGSIRSKKNSKRIYARGRFKKVLPSKAYEIWEKQAQQIVRYFLYGYHMETKGRIDYGFEPPLTCPIHIEAHFYCKGPLPDLSGALESCGDMLEGILYENDKQICSWDGSRVWHDKDNPRTEIKVTWGYDFDKTLTECGL
jgi:Holliday junction resolvase RusA-like endonuclease